MLSVFEEALCGAHFRHSVVPGAMLKMRRILRIPGEHNSPCWTLCWVPGGGEASNQSNGKFFRVG